jgi:hypothetical protein
MLLDIRGVRAVLALAVPLLLAPAVATAEPAGDVLRLDDVPALARESNPEIRAA